jgi:hypothetical protein
MAAVVDDAGATPLETVVLETAAEVGGSVVGAVVVGAVAVVGVAVGSLTVPLMTWPSAPVVTVTGLGMPVCRSHARLSHDSMKRLRMNRWRSFEMPGSGELPEASRNGLSSSTLGSPTFSRLWQ